MSLACNQCQTVAVDPLDWIAVGPAGWETQTLAGDRKVGDLVFCSWTCLSDWALARSAEALAR